MVSFIMRKDNMKLINGVYQTNRTTVFQSNVGAYPVQANAGQVIHVSKSVRGGYVAQLHQGKNKHDVIIKNDQASSLTRLRGLGK